MKGKFSSIIGVLIAVFLVFGVVIMAAPGPAAATTHDYVIVAATSTPNAISTPQAVVGGDEMTSAIESGPSAMTADLSAAIPSALETMSALTAAPTAAEEVAMLTVMRPAPTPTAETEMRATNSTLATDEKALTLRRHTTGFSDKGNLGGRNLGGLGVMLFLLTGLMAYRYRRRVIDYCRADPRQVSSSGGSFKPLARIPSRC